MQARESSGGFTRLKEKVASSMIALYLRLTPLVKDEITPRLSLSSYVSTMRA